VSVHTLYLFYNVYFKYFFILFLKKVAYHESNIIKFMGFVLLFDNLQ